MQRLSRPAEALASLQKAAELGAAWREVDFAIAICLLNLKRYAEAVDVLDKCLSAYPGYVPALFTKGVALHLLWDLDGAARLYSEVLDLEPDSAETLLNMISVGLQRKDYEFVRQYSDRLRCCSRTLPLPSKASHSTPSTQAIRGRPGDYARLTELAPKAPEYWLNLGITCDRRRFTTKRWAPSRRASSPPGFPHRLLQSRPCLWNQPGPAAARQCYENAITKWPDGDDLMLSLSFVLEEMELDEDAEAACARFCAATTDREQVWFRLGYLRLKLNRPAEAIEPLQNALARQNEWPEAEVDLALACFSSGQLDESESVLKGLLARHRSTSKLSRVLPRSNYSAKTAPKRSSLHLRLSNWATKPTTPITDCGAFSPIARTPRGSSGLLRDRAVAAK